MVAALILSLGHKDDAPGAGTDRKAGLKRRCGDQRVVEGGVFGDGCGVDRAVDGAKAKDELLLLNILLLLLLCLFWFRGLGL